MPRQNALHGPERWWDKPAGLPYRLHGPRARPMLEIEALRELAMRSIAPRSVFNQHTAVASPKLATFAFLLPHFRPVKVKE